MIKEMKEFWNKDWFQTNDLGQFYKANFVRFSLEEMAEEINTNDDLYEFDYDDVLELMLMDKRYSYGDNFTEYLVKEFLDREDWIIQWVNLKINSTLEKMSKFWNRHLCITNDLGLFYKLYCDDYSIAYISKEIGLSTDEVLEIIYSDDIPSAYQDKVKTFLTKNDWFNEKSFYSKKHLLEQEDVIEVMKQETIEIL